MKKQSIVFAGADEIAARDFAFHQRDKDSHVSVASAYEFNGGEVGGQVYIMPDVPRWHKDRIAAAYPDFIQVKETERVRQFVRGADAELRTIMVRPRGRPRMAHSA